MNGAEKPTIDGAEKVLADLKPVSMVCARSVHDLRISVCKAKEWMKKFDKAKVNLFIFHLLRSVKDESN